MFGYAEKDFESNFDGYIDEINVKEDIKLNHEEFNSENVKKFIHEYTLWLANHLNENEKVNRSLVYDELDDLISNYVENLDD